VASRREVERQARVQRLAEAQYGCPGVQPIAAAVRNLSDVAVGVSVWDIEQLWNRMYRWLHNNGMGGVVMAAISAIDTALYDIVGHKLGVPA
jgi:L-alanine-DL-glutamate epimerase-like enolase superfamily enzyme